MLQTKPDERRRDMARLLTYPAFVGGACTSAEREALILLAKRHGQTLSETIRALIRDAAKRDLQPTGEDDEAA
jgi:hypothetical protein